MSNPWLTLSSDLLHLLQKVLMTKDSNKSVICTHTHTLKCKHNSEEEEKKIADKRQGIDAVGGKSQVYIFPFSLFSKDSETRFCGFIRVNCPGIYCFQSKSTINHLAHRDSHSSKRALGLSADPQTALHIACSSRSKRHCTVSCSCINQLSLFSFYSSSPFSFLSIPYGGVQFPAHSTRSVANARWVRLWSIFFCVCVFFLYKDDIKVKHHLCNWIVFTES